MDFDWSSAHPIASGDFSVAWSGSLQIATAGTYTFGLDSDDGSALSLNGSVVVDNSGAHGSQLVTNTVQLSAGQYTVSLMYFECCGGPAEVHFYWTPPGGSGLVVVPQAVLFSAAGAVPDESAPPGMEPQEHNGTSNDPVGTFSGDFHYSFADVAVPGRGPTPTFARSYDSADTRVGPLGPGWTDNYATRLRHPGDGSADLLFVGANGNTDRYTHSPDDSFSPPPAVFRTLVHNADGTYTAKEMNQASWTFDATGNLTAITDPYGNASTLGYNAQVQLATISDPAGRGALALAYTNGRITSVTDWASPARTVTYQYDTNGRLWKVTDRDGQTTTFGYEGTSQRLTTITDARAHMAVTMTYDAQGLVLTQKDAQGLSTGAVTTFAYVVNGDGTRATTVTYPPTSFAPTFSPTVVDSYNALGWLTSRVSRPTSTETLTESYAYDATGNRTVVTDPRGNTTDYCYDVSYAGAAIAGSRGNLTRQIGPAPAAGANRPVTLHAYDARNNPTQIVAPKGVPSGASATCATDLSAISTLYATDLAYDSTAAKLLSTTRRFTDPDSGAQTATTKFEYADAANPGSVTRIIPPRGNTATSPDYTFATTFTYGTTGSQAGMLVATTDALGNTYTTAYDAVGRTTAAVDQLGNASGGVPADHTTDYIYDNEDRVRFVKLPSPTAGGSRLVTESRYDEVGNRIVQIDADGQVTTYAYDVRDGLFQVKESPSTWTDPLNPPAGVITTEYGYDSAGNLARMTRAKGDPANERVTDYAYDGRALARRETQYPSWPTTSPTLVTTSAYDQNGNRTTLVDPLARTTTSVYDRLNRLTTVDYSDPATPDATYAYDANGNRSSMIDGTGSTSYAYDEVNRLTAVTSPGPKTVGYRYDLDGNRTKLIYPDATAVTYNFDKSSRLSSLLDWASRSVSYAYWPDGALKTATKPDTSVASYTYDNARRATGIVDQRAGSLITQLAYTLDPIGNVTQTQEWVRGISQGSAAWLDRAIVNDATAGDPFSGPAIAMSADGAVHAVWVDTTAPTKVLRYSRRDPTTGTWSAGQRVGEATGFSEYEPAMVVDAANNVYVAWTDARHGTDTDIYFSKRSASTGTWSQSVKVSDDTGGKPQLSASIALSATGAAVAVWRDERGGGGKKYIYSARLPAGGTTWATNIKVTSDANSDKRQPRVVIGADGTAYTDWADDRNSAQYDIYFASLASAASSWSTNVKISDDPGTTYQMDPDIGVDTSGNIIAVWRDQRTNPATLRATRRPAGSSTWSASVNVGGSDASHARLSVRSDGRAYVVWQGISVWGSEFNPATLSWSTPEQIAIGEGGGKPTVALNNSQAAVLYTSLSGTGSFDVYARLKPLGTGFGGPDTFGYGYDKLQRLTSVGGTDGNRTYGYDPIGNRASKVVAGVTTIYSYDRADRISAAGAMSITVNANGNTTAKGADTFTYDQPNRLKSATVAGATETYAYDGNGVRFSRQIGTGTPIRYVTDVNTSLPVTIDDGTRKYVYGLGLAYDVSGSTLEVYHTDRLGSVRAITSATGTVTATYRTDEWGNPTSLTGASTQPFGFTGEPRDATGLTYLRARYYDPSLGRFTSRDALAGSTGTPASLNRFTYAENNPVSRVDHSGRATSRVLINAAGLTVLLLAGAACVWSGACEVAAAAAVGEVAVTAALDIVTPAEETATAATIEASQAQQLAQILAPGGQAIGTAGSGGDPLVREVGGGLSAAADLFARLAEGGKVLSVPNYPGTLVQLPGGGLVGLRELSGSGDAAIDVNIPGLEGIVTKIHFGQ